MNQYLSMFFLFCTCIVNAGSPSQWQYVEVQTGDPVILDLGASTITIDKFIERANFCADKSEFICLTTKRYKFAFPKKYKGQKVWRWKNYTFCKANNKQLTESKRRRMLVYVWEGASCGENYVGSYLYSVNDGLQYISTKLGLTIGQLDLLAVESKGFGAQSN
jgi:hypothetical protein